MIEPKLTIVSGGQTGVDRAALDVALELGIPIAGWCPAGRLAEDGRISDAYPLVETESREYAVRTRWNVRDSDGTLIITSGEPSGGTALTIEFTRQLHKPCLLVDVSDDWRSIDLAKVRLWIETEQIRRPNIAGPRESTSPGIHARSSRFLRECWRIF